MPQYCLRNLVVYILIPAVVLGLHAATYYPFLCDDAFISMRYSQRLIEGLGLTWSAGQPVEGYSNLSWVLATGFLGWLGLDMVVAVRLLGFCSFIAVLWLNFSLWYQPVSSASEKDKIRQNTALLWSQWFLVICAPIAVWSIAGLEQPFVGLFMVSAVACIYLFYKELAGRYLLLASIALALLCLTRPDAPLVCVALGLGMFWVRGLNKQSITHVALLAILPIIAVSAQMAFRLYYYQDFVPNTAHIKTGFSPLHILQGLLYIVQTLLCLLPWSFYFIRESFIATQKGESLIKLATPIMALWVIYTIYIGGDIFPGLRHMVPMIVLMTIISPLLFTQLIAKGWFSNKLKVVFLSAIFIAIQLLNPVSMPARYETWEWDGQVLAYTLKDGFSTEQPVFAVTGAGALPFYSEFDAIDMLGLNDFHIARNPASDPSQHYIAHGHADGEYVFARRPDLVSFCIPWESQYEPCFISGEQLHAIPEFKQQYVAARFRGFRPYEYTGIVWVYKYSEKIGMKSDGNSMTVPAYLLSDYRHSVTTLYEGKDKDKGFVISISKDLPAKVSGIKMSGPVTVSSVPAHAGLSFTVHEDDSGLLSVEVSTAQNEAIDIQALIVKPQSHDMASSTDAEQVPD